VFLPIPTIVLVIIPAFRKWGDRKKVAKEYRRKIKTEVDLLFTSYSGKIKLFEKKWKNQEKQGKEFSPVKIPDSDKVCFEKLSNFSIEAAPYLRDVDKDYMHELHEIFRKGKYMSPQGEVIKKDDIYKISEITKNLQNYLKKKT